MNRKFGEKLMPLQKISVGNGDDARNIAVRCRQGKNPGLVWLGGYRSDMMGSKAQALDEWAKRNEFANCRHDYSGHGESGGDFIEGTISRWLEESLAVFDICTRGPQILVGSSMGAWIALRMVQELVKRKEANRLHGLLLLAPAPDFTHELMAPNLSEEHKVQLQTLGYMEEPSQYSDEPDIFTNALFEDGELNRVMSGPIETGCPVHIIQGMKDEDVPYSHALNLMKFLPFDDVTLTLVKDGDHRLSRDKDIELIIRKIELMTKS
jgi:pimeloyl-ACP methyl ester carboxylesterase